MQKYTRPLEKLTPNTVSLERIIIKAIYDTVFIHRKICPGALFLQFGSMPDSTPPALPCRPHQPSPPRTREGTIEPLWGSGCPSAAPREPPPQRCRRRQSDSARGNGTSVGSTPVLPKPEPVPARSEQGNRAQRPSLRHCSRAPSTALRVQLRGHQART